MAFASRVEFYLGSVQANAALGMASLAMQLFMWIYGLIIYLDTPASHRKGREPYLAISLALCIATFVSAVANNWLAYHVLLKTTDLNEARRVVAEVYAGAPPVIAAISFNSVLLIGDALLIYRAYLIWTDRQWVIIPPFLAYLSNIAVTIRYFTPLSRLRDNSNNIFLSVSTYLKVSTDVYITFVISYRLFLQYRRLRETIPSADNKVYLGIIAILIESALPVALLGIAYAVTIVKTQGELEYRVYLVVTLAYYIFCQLSPQWIIFRVAVGRSWVGNPDKDRSFIVSRGLEFAHVTDSSEVEDVSDMLSVPHQSIYQEEKPRSDV